MKDLDKTLQTYFLDKAPKMPADIQKMIVKYGPYLVLIGVVFAAFSILVSLGVMSFAMPFSMMSGVYVGTMMHVYMIFTILTTILNALAVPGLFNKTKQGWTYLFYSVLLGTVMNIVSFNIAGLLLGSVLGFYVLYQIKSHYK